MDKEQQYNPSRIEKKWQEKWMSAKLFSSSPDEREAFSIVIPPPNVTGVLHMGHMLNNTIQDILIRRARQQNKNALWVPGTDHASIATEAKVVQMLREKGIKKSDISRDEFLNHAWEWKEKYGGIILEQLKYLGASCDFERTAFTMDEIRSKAVLKAFVDLYKKGKLYRAKRMINWDPQAKTVLSNEEVIHSEEQAHLYHILYKLEGSGTEGIVIATQRPETIMADSAVCVHPEDKRYLHLHGKQVIIPLINKSIPIIADPYIDMEFGTGALKVTPAHDPNDFELGKRFGLEIIDSLNEDGTLNESAQILVGEDRFAARKKIGPMLEEAGVLIKIEPYKTNIGRSERTNAVVEPRLSLQWFVSMKELAEPALKAVENNEIQFVPEHFKNTYKHWMDNIKDWCISRQLWWGHRIPAWYIDEHIVVAESAEEALSEAKTLTGNPGLQLSDLQQDEDVLDTWFSAWLWPMSVFNADEQTEDFKYYFPTQVLVTGWDIIFLWVARMIMSSYEWQGRPPFEKVYFTGMVRDKQRRKMSKSLGNSPDALELIENYGADGVRFGLLSCSPAGGDLLFDNKLCEQGRNFSNKMWNALRLINGWNAVPNAKVRADEKLLVNWIEHRFNEVFQESEQLAAQLKLSDAVKTLYSFVWDDFCSFFLESAKPSDEFPLSQELKDKAVSIFDRICILLHPYMPFITEEIWQDLAQRMENEYCASSLLPEFKATDANLLMQMKELRDVVKKIRELRAKHQISRTTEAPLFILESERSSLIELSGAVDLLCRFCKLTTVDKTRNEIKNAQAFIGLRDSYYLVLPVVINTEEEKIKLREEIAYAEGFIASVNKKLENPKFMSSAPADLVAKEQQKMEDGRTRLKALVDRLNSL